jgi:hypothetical protein
MTLWENNVHWARQESARTQVELDMGVRCENIPRGRRGVHTADWILKRAGKPVAVAEYKHRLYVPPNPRWCWQVDVKKIDAVKAHAKRLDAIPLYIVESYDPHGMFKCGVHCTFNVIVGTVLKDSYPVGSMTLNRPREAGDRDDPVYNIPDGDMASLHILAERLW